MRKSCECERFIHSIRKIISITKSIFLCYEAFYFFNHSRVSISMKAKPLKQKHVVIYVLLGLRLELKCDDEREKGCGWMGRAGAEIEHEKSSGGSGGGDAMGWLCTTTIRKMITFNRQ